MQSNIYSRLETSLFLALPGIFEARFFSRAPRIPENPDIQESRYSSEAQKGLVSSLHVIQDGCSVCAHDDMMIYSWLSRSCSNLKARGGKFLFIESNRTLIETIRTLIESNRTLIETNRINQEKLWKIWLIRLPFDWFRSIENQSITNGRSIAFDWLRLWTRFFEIFQKLLILIIYPALCV